MIYRLELEHLMIHITGIKFQIQIIQTGCHTYEINQNENDGWIRVFLQEGTEYKIGMIGSPNDFDEYIWLYDKDRNYISQDDETQEWVNDVSVDSCIWITPSYTGEYYIKIGSWNNSVQNYTATVHCEPAPVNQNSGGGSGGPELIEIDDNCYVIEVEVMSAGGYVCIEDENPSIDWRRW